jgi:hypothetical protein
MMNVALCNLDVSVFSNSFSSGRGSGEEASPQRRFV